MVLLLIASMTSAYSAYRYVGSIGTEVPGRYFVNPVGICSDPSGTVYVFDGDLHRVFLFSSEGKMIRSFGSLAFKDVGTSGKTVPMACSGNGVLLVVSDKTLLRVDLKGKVLSKSGVPASSSDSISGIALGTDGSCYMVDKESARLFSFDRTGKLAGDVGLPETSNNRAAVPAGIAVDPEGNLAISDELMRTVRKFDTSGKYLKWSCSRWSDMPKPGSGEVASIGGPSISTDGVLYVVDTSFGMVSRFDRFGKCLGSFRVAEQHSNRTSIPMTLSDGKSAGIWAIDADKKSVRKFDAITGNPLIALGSVAEEPGQIASPWKLALDSEDNLYVLDLQKYSILKFSSVGKFIGFIAGNGSEKCAIGMPSGLALDQERKVLYVADAGNNRIIVFRTTGEYVREFRGENVGKEEWSPGEVSLAKSGNLFVAVAIGGGSIQEFSPEGKLTGKYLKSKLDATGPILPDDAGGLYFGAKDWVYRYNLSSGEQVGKIGALATGKDSKAGSLQYPVDIKIGPNRHLYVVDVDPSSDRHGRVLEFDQSGAFIGSIGGVGSGAGEFNGASAVAVGSRGDVYVSDVGNHRVVHFSPIGEH